MQLATRNLKLLFIHGWATDSRIWKYQLEEFSNDYEVIAIDLPGHGSNDKWSEPTLKSAVEKVLSTINPTSHIPHLTSCFIGIGWSLGGKVLLEIAANNPCFFKGIILIASSPCFVAKDDFTAGQSRGIAKRMLKDLQNDFTGTIKRFYPLNFVQEEFAAENAQWFVDYYDKKCAAFQHDSIINSLEALFSFDIREKLRDIKIPILIIQGNEDTVCPPEASRYLAENFANARLEIIEGSGHIPFLTRRKEFNKIVRGFIETL